MKHNNNFDLIRILAALQVLSMHTGEWLKLPYPSILSWLWLFPGVPIFFVTSGFLITSSLIERKQTPLEYATNRALRIYPGMLVNLAVILAMMIVAGVVTISSFGNLRFLTFFPILGVTGWSTLAFTVSGGHGMNWGTSTLPFFPGGVLWTIGVELGFYALIPFIVGRRWTNFAIPTVFALSLWLAFSQAHIKSQWIDTTIFTYLWIFLIGATARVAWPWAKVAFTGTFPLWLLAHVWLWTVPDYKQPTLIVVASIFTLSGTVLSFAHTIPKLSNILRGQDISYGVYLYHMPVVMVFMALGQRESAWLWAAVLFGTTCLASLSWVAIEKPALLFKKNMPDFLGRLRAEKYTA